MTPDDIENVLDRMEISANELGRRVGVAPATVSRWRSGERPVTRTQAIAILGLDYKLNELLDLKYRSGALHP